MSSRPLRIDADTVESGPLALDKGPVTHTVDGPVLQATPDLLRWCRRHFAERDPGDFDWERGGRRKLYERGSNDYWRFYKAAHQEAPVHGVRAFTVHGGLVHLLYRNDEIPVESKTHITDISTRKLSPEEARRWAKRPYGA